MKRHFRTDGWNLVSSWLHPNHEKRSKLVVSKDRFSSPWSVDTPEKATKLRRHLFHYTRNKNWDSIGLSKDMFCDPDAFKFNSEKANIKFIGEESNVENNRCENCFSISCICIGKFNDTTHKIISPSTSVPLETLDACTESNVQCEMNNNCNKHQELQQSMKKKSSSLSKLFRHSLNSMFKTSASFD